DHNVEEINLFADIPDMEFKMFDPQHAYHPDAITAQGIRALRDKGVEVFLDSNPAAHDLAAFGLDSILTVEEKYELSGIFREPSHILYLLCDAVPVPWIDQSLSQAPKPIRKAAAGRLPWVALYDAEDSNLTEVRQQEGSLIDRIVSIRLPSGRHVTF